jgi:uncharacterized protein YdeI (YjbR/CyaY-like superfamily)
MLPEVDHYIAANEKWRAELTILRDLALAAGMEEAWKWNAPVYTQDDRNVVILAALKKDCTLSFFKGALLEDPANILEKPGPHSVGVRVIRFPNLTCIKELSDVLPDYLAAAVANEIAGKIVAAEPPEDIAWAEELTAKLAANPEFAAAFHTLTPGRKRAFNIFYTGAKQSSTRASRVEQSVRRVMAGYGPNDCTCGLAKSTNCDGSHRAAGVKPW